jgi:hypothetical protein
MFELALAAAAGDCLASHAETVRHLYITGWKCTRRYPHYPRLPTIFRNAILGMMPLRLLHRAQQISMFERASLRPLARGCRLRWGRSGLHEALRAADRYYLSSGSLLCCEPPKLLLAVGVQLAADFEVVDDTIAVTAEPDPEPPCIDFTASRE